MNVVARPPALIRQVAAFQCVAVKWVRHWNEHLFSFAVERPASFRFRSGEFVMIGLPGDTTKLLMRAYPIASPAWSDELEFLSIKASDGPLTSRLQGIHRGDELYLGRKATGTLVADALISGRRLFLLSTGTGLAPFLSLAGDRELYERFEQVVVVHSVRRVSDLAYHEAQTALWAQDLLVSDVAAVRFHYVPTVTREQFHTMGRIDALLEAGSLFSLTLSGPRRSDPDDDRIMLRGSTAMIRDMDECLNQLGFVEGSTAQPASYVIARAFVD